MDVAYDLTTDDFVAFNVHHQRRSPLVRTITTSAVMVVWLVVAVAVALYALFAVRDRTTLIVCLLLWGAVVSVFGFLLWRMARRAPSNRPSAGLVAERDTSSMVGPYKLNVTRTEITESSPQGEATCAMSAVEKIVVTGDHAFIYSSPVQAFVVPRRAFATSVDFESLVAMIEQFSRKSAMRETG
jgi:hypothetical protein